MAAVVDILFNWQREQWTTMASESIYMYVCVCIVNSCC